jgi:hypothetical protein
MSVTNSDSTNYTWGGYNKIPEIVLIDPDNISISQFNSNIFLSNGCLRNFNSFTSTLITKKNL